MFVDFIKKYVDKNNKNANRELLLSGNMLQAILMLAIPVVINSFLQTMYNLTDTYWLGRLGTEELAAINLVTPMQNIVVNFGSGLTVAGSVLISQYLGAKRDEDARSMANQIFACALMFSVVCAGLCAFFTPSIVTWLGAEGETWRHSKTYMQLVILDMPFLFTVNMYTAMNQAQGDTLSPMLLNLTGILINMVLDPLFMVLLHMGVAGAALATVSAKAFPAVIAFILLQNREKDVYLELRRLKFEKEKLKSILVVGMPTAIGGSTMQFGFLLMSRNVFKYGTQAMAAYGIGNKINSLITLPTNGIHNSSMGLFQGSGHTEVTMLIDAARLWIFRFATLYVCETWLHMGVRSIWYSVVVSNGLSATVLFIIYKTGYWRRKRI